MRTRKTITHIICCNKGDRFYFINDSRKIIWQVMEHTAKPINGEVKKVSICRNDAGLEKVYLSTRVIVFMSKERDILDIAFIHPLQPALSIITSYSLNYSLKPGGKQPGYAELKKTV